MNRTFAIFYLAASLVIIAAMTGVGYQTGYQRAYQEQEVRVLACSTEWWTTMEALNYALNNAPAP